MASLSPPVAPCSQSFPCRTYLKDTTQHLSSVCVLHPALILPDVYNAPSSLLTIYSPCALQILPRLPERLPFLVSLLALLAILKKLLSF